MLTALLLSLVASAAGGPNLLENTTFDDGIEGWGHSLPAEAEPAAMPTVGWTEAVGGGAAFVDVPAAAEVSWPHLFQTAPAAPGDIFEASADVLGTGITGGYGAYLSIEFRDAAGERLSFTQSGAVTQAADWQRVSARGIAPPKAVRVSLALLLNGRGRASFDNAVLRQVGRASMKPVGGPVTLSVDPDPRLEPFLGFGWEDDGWFYNAENAEHGADEAAYALREDRIRSLDGDLVRMFFWYEDFNPARDFATYDWDTNNMRSKYRTLDLYQALGIPVNVVGVRWGWEGLYDRPSELARMVGDLLEHLVEARGYTCIRYWTLANEPDNEVLRETTFERFVEVTRLVDEQIRNRGLDIDVVGSDEAVSFEVFRETVRNDAYFQTADLYASHMYLHAAGAPLVKYRFEERLALLHAREPFKPLYLAEFGFQDDRSTHLLNPLMEEYRYAPLVMSAVCDGLNIGLSAFSIWTLHEVYYPGNGFMNYGLWDFGGDWPVRPVYHAWAALTRRTEPGMPVHRVASSHPNRLKAAVVGDTLYWVNRGHDDVRVELVGFAPAGGRTFTRDTVAGHATGLDDNAGAAPRYDEAGRLIAPAMGFGWLARAE
jgi:hypothetical protein